MKSKDWVWMPHAGHLVVGSMCRFHLNTLVNGRIVSTVGEYLPPEGSWPIYAESKRVILEGRGDELERDFLKKVGFVEIGAGRMYETMVFKARKSTARCCAWEQSSGENLDFDGYNDAGDAAAGHLAMCKKWAKKKRA